jgi:hypothetical protein
VVSKNDNSKRNLTLSDVNLALGFNGATLSGLESWLFDVTLWTFLHSDRAPSDPVGTRAMMEDISIGLVRIDLDWKGQDETEGSASSRRGSSRHVSLTYLSEHASLHVID